MVNDQETQGVLTCDRLGMVTALLGDGLVEQTHLTDTKRNGDPTHRELINRAKIVEHKMLKHNAFVGKGESFDVEEMLEELKELGWEPDEQKIQNFREVAAMRRLKGSQKP